MLKKTFIALAVVATIMACAAIGLRLSPYLAKQLGYAPFRQAAVERDAIPRALIDLISSGSKSIVIVSEVIENRLVLEAVLAAKNRNVATIVVLSGPRNQSELRGARAWLRDNGIPSRVTVAPFKGTIIVIDEERAATSSSPILITSGFKSEQSTLHVFEHKPTAREYFERIRSWTLSP